MNHNFVIFDHPIKLRQVQQEDLNYLISWRNKNEIRKWFFNQETISLNQQEIWFKNYLNNDKDIMFIIEEVQDIKAPIGSCALYNINSETQTAEFGRLIIGDFNARKKGFGLKSVKLICNFGFSYLGLTKISLEVFKENSSAIRIYQQAGFESINTYEKNNQSVLLMELVDKNFAFTEK